MSDSDREHQEAERKRRSRKMEAIGTLTSGVAHDFNNLLMGIDGCAEMALRELASDHPAREYVAQIKDAITRGTGLTRQLLTFGRSDPAPTTVVDLDETVEGVGRLLRPLLGERVDFEVSLGAGGARVRCDDTGVDQIILNLVVNARDAVDGQGRIEVRTECVDIESPRPARIGELEAGRWARIAIRDDGIGMAEETLDQMFEPFFTTKAAGDGTGLGLSTVYGIVGQSGGAIEVDSAPGIGTTFVIYLPVTEAVEPADATDPGAGVAMQDHPAAGSSTPGVLLVEDNAVARDATRDLLESEGMETFAAENGRVARRLFEQQRDEIDLVVMDLTLPDTGGSELAAALRGDCDTLPVLFVSGAMPEDAPVRETIEEPRTRFLQKPVGLESLVGAIGDLLAT